jgi:outer membrane murein-binding lipoprotein Lpp
MERQLGRISLIAAIVGTLALGGCATVDSVKRAQASADSAGSAAQRAQGSADAAGAAATAAGDAAKKAQDSADAAGTAATGAATDIKTANARIDRLERKVRWLARHHRPAKKGHHKVWCKANKWHPHPKC